MTRLITSECCSCCNTRFSQSKNASSSQAMWVWRLSITSHTHMMTGLLHLEATPETECLGKMTKRRKLRWEPLFPSNNSFLSGGALVVLILQANVVGEPNSLQHSGYIDSWLQWLSVHEMILHLPTLLTACWLALLLALLLLSL